MSRRIVIADDHELTRVGIRASLENTGWEVVAEAATGPDAVDAVIRECPDIALLDLQMPGGGLAAVAEIVERMPEAAVVMFTGSDSDEHLFAALHAGASGYLLKGTDPDRLSHALNGVLMGEAAIPRRLVTSLVREFQSRERVAPVPPQSLTAREDQVLEALRAGLPTRDIAAALGLSEVTVRRHVSAVLHKLGVDSREAAVDA